MKSKGTWQIAVGITSLVVTVFVLPMPLFEVFSGIAGQGAAALFVLGLVLLVAGLGFVSVGLLKRSRDRRTARSYDTREPTSSDGDRPVNPHAVPNTYGALPPPRGRTKPMISSRRRGLGQDWNRADQNAVALSSWQLVRHVTPGPDSPRRT
jgi:hypothetical protein